MTSPYGFLCEHMIKGVQRCNNPCMTPICGEHKTNKVYKPCIGCGKMTYARSQRCTKCGIQANKAIDKERRQLIKLERAREIEEVRERIAKISLQERLQQLEINKNSLLAEIEKTISEIKNKGETPETSN